MLLRKQILIPGWLNEYIKNRATLSGQSEGEILRGMTCEGLLHTFRLLGREYDATLDERLKNIVKKTREENSPDLDEIRLYLDDLYFEARKLAEETLEKFPQGKS